jgi:hypothetical protein
MDCLSDSCVLVIVIMVCSGFAFSGVPFVWFPRKWKETRIIKWFLRVFLLKI